MKIYVISVTSYGKKTDIAYATSFKKVNEYLSLTTGYAAIKETADHKKEWYYEDMKSTKNIFKRHQENVRYKGKEGTDEWYSFRVEEGF